MTQRTPAGKSPERRSISYKLYIATKWRNWMSVGKFSCRVASRSSRIASYVYRNISKTLSS